MTLQRHASLTKQVETDGFDAYKFGLLIEETMVGEQGPKFKTKKSFSPSSLGYGHGTCPRYWHLAFSGAMFDDTADAIGVSNMGNGTFVHERLQKVLSEALGENVEIEREINYTNPPIRGFVDAIVEFDGVKAVGEIKSAKQEIFDGLASSRKPIAYHLVQLLLYCRVLGIKNGFFYYENKNTQQFVIIPVEVNDALEKYTDDIFEWMRLVDTTFKDGKLANPISPKRKAVACRYCPLVDECIKRPDGDIQIDTLTVLP